MIHERRFSKATQLNLFGSVPTARPDAVARPARSLHGGRPGIRAEWLDAQTRTIAGALKTLYGSARNLSVRVHPSLPHQTVVAVHEQGKNEPRVSVRVSPRGYKVDMREGMAREVLIRALESMIGPKGIRQG